MFFPSCMRCHVGCRRSFANRTSLKPTLLRVGDAFQSVRSFTEEDVRMFAELTHDSNPLHKSTTFAAASRFGSRVVHGMFYGTMFSAIIGQKFPGSIYVSQSLQFHKPVLIGDTVTALIEVKEVGPGGRLLAFGTRSLNQRNELVLSGEARVLMPKTEIDRAGNDQGVG